MKNFYSPSSLQNNESKEYRCNEARSMRSVLSSPSCDFNIEPASKSAEGNIYTIQNCKNDEYFQDSIGTMSSTANSDKQYWEIEPYGKEENQFTIRNVYNKEYMTKKASQLHSGKPGKDEIWVIKTIHKVTLETSVETIDYLDTPPSKEARQIDIQSARIINNNSPAEIQTEVDSSTDKESTFEWSLTETLAIGIETKFKGSIPFFGGAESTLNVGLTLESNQTSTISKSEHYSVKETITVPPYTSLSARGYIAWDDNVKVPFIMKLLVTGTADNGNRAATAEELKRELKVSGFSGNVIKEDAKSLTVSLKGEITGAFGIKTGLDVKELNENSKVT